MARTVCIIGAGPSGLVAAKTLSYDHKASFHVTVFEQSHRIGGLWPISEIDDGLVNPDMCTNQSRHTVSFSDSAWAETSPSFPKAWQVGQYLEQYIEKYPGYDIQLNTRVLKTSHVNGKWKVHIQRTISSATAEELEFDHLIVATGFFGKPKMPKGLDNVQIPVRHSSKIRDVKDLLTDGNEKPVAVGRNIVVVGGQMSGVETAASIAAQISSAANSPGESHISDAEKYVITHIVQQPVWVMPLFFPNNPDVEVSGSGDKAQKEKNRSPDFLPLDLVAYNLGWRPPGPVQNTSGHITPEAAGITHNFMETYIGNDQSDLGISDLALVGDIRSEPPLLACSDQYTEFVRHQKIRLVTGKVKGVSGEANAIEIIDRSGNSTSITDVAAIVCATGFDASPSLDFLPDETLDTLKFVPTDDGFPLALNVHTSVSKAVPSLGFVGFYRSPYWGVMEMQARFLARLWSGDSNAQQALEEDKTIDSMLKLRDDPRRAQFPMGDYAYLMESFSEILGIKRSEPKGSTGRTGLVLPPRYIYDTADEKQHNEAVIALSIIDKIFTDSATKGKFVARAVFRGLQGIWHLERTINSRLDTFPSGTLHGTASFLLRNPTDGESDMEYLYFEEGDFKTTWGGTMHAKRSYIYHYSEAIDKINVWFAKQDYQTADYFFHQIDFVVREKKGEGNDPWRASSSHLCVEDMYDVTYEFYFKGAALDSWTSEYTVKGPKKDYTIQNVYTRPK